MLWTTWERRSALRDRRTIERVTLALMNLEHKLAGAGGTGHSDLAVMESLQEAVGMQRQH